MASVDDALAAELESAAIAHGMDVLIEVHDEGELDRALRLKSPMIGINNRNLHTFEVSLDTTRRLSRLVPEDRQVVAESGLFTPGRSGRHGRPWRAPLPDRRKPDAAGRCRRRHRARCWRNR
jgi:indole-3-glycerol phosphate synthase